MMDVRRVSAKFWLADPTVVGAGAKEYIPVFHRWIQKASVEGLLIDVADYGHVPDGPGVMLIGHEADRSLDLREGPGFRYEGKREAGDAGGQIAQALAAAARGAALLEADPALDGVRFDCTRVRVAIADRLNAPNNDASLELLLPAVKSGVEEAFPGAGVAAAERIGDERRPFGVDVTFGSPVDLAAAALSVAD